MRRPLPCRLYWYTWPYLRSGRCALPKFPPPNHPVAVRFRPQAAVSKRFSTA